MLTHAHSLTHALFPCLTLLLDTRQCDERVIFSILIVMYIVLRTSGWRDFLIKTQGSCWGEGTEDRSDTKPCDVSEWVISSRILGTRECDHSISVGCRRREPCLRTMEKIYIPWILSHVVWSVNVTDGCHSSNNSGHDFMTALCNMFNIRGVLGIFMCTVHRQLSVTSHSRRWVQ